MAEELSFTERWLMGELLKLIQEAVAFASRTLGADLDQAGLPSIEEELQLGSRLVELGTVIVSRATERQQDRELAAVEHAADITEARVAGINRATKRAMYETMLTNPPGMSSARPWSPYSPSCCRTVPPARPTWDNSRVRSVWSNWKSNSPS